MLAREDRPPAWVCHIFCLDSRPCPADRPRTFAKDPVGCSYACKAQVSETLHHNWEDAFPLPCTNFTKRGTIDRLCTDLQSKVVQVLVYQASLISRIKNIHFGGRAAVEYFVGKKGWTKLTDSRIITDGSVQFA